MVRVLQTAESRLRPPAASFPDGAGATLTVLPHWNGRLVNASVGDSAFSLLRDGALHQDVYYAPDLVRSLVDRRRRPATAGDQVRGWRTICWRVST